VREHERAVRLVEVLVEAQARRGTREHARKRRLAHGERVPPHVLPVQFNQVEGIEEHPLVMMAVPDVVEARNAILTARDRLALHDAGLERSRASASTISGKRLVRSLPGRL
jgi:hypothetical protein